jgi:hypothetical protein
MASRSLSPPLSAGNPLKEFLILLPLLLHKIFYAFSLVIGSERSARRKKQKDGLSIDTPTVSLTAASMTDLDNITQHQIIYKKVNILAHIILLYLSFCSIAAFNVSL